MGGKVVFISLFCPGCQLPHSDTLVTLDPSKHAIAINWEFNEANRLFNDKRLQVLLSLMRKFFISYKTACIQEYKPIIIIIVSSRNL